MNVRRLCGFAALSVLTALAQRAASSAQLTPATTATITITGCVTGSAGALPIVLADSMTLPYGSAAVPPVSVAGSALGLPIPEGLAGETTRPTLPVTSGGTPGAASSLGAIDVGSATIGVGTTGTSRTPPTPVGTAGLSAVTAPAAAPVPADISAPSVEGYRLSGINMTAWVGRRVQITGVIVASTATEQAVAGEETEQEEAPTPPMPEFHVVSVQSVTGPCPR